MSFEGNWKTPKVWDIKVCDDGWDLDENNELEFTGTASSVTINYAGTGNAWAENCSHTTLPGGLEQVEGKTTNGDKSFIITLTTSSGGTPQLECTPSEANTLLAKEGGFLQSMKQLAAQELRRIARKLNRWADGLYDEETDGQPGGWTAEEGGTNAPVVYYEERPHVRQRRRA